jgi:hypothetical protein
MNQQRNDFNKNVTSPAIFVRYIPYIHPLPLAKAKNRQSSSHQTACFKYTKGLHPPPKFRANLSQQTSAAKSAELRILSRLHSPKNRGSCHNVVRFCCDLEARNLATVSTVKPRLTEVEYGRDVNWEQRHAIQDHFETNSEKHSINTWNKKQRHRPSANLSYSQKSAHYADISTFNGLLFSLKSYK